MTIILAALTLLASTAGIREGVQFLLERRETDHDYGNWRRNEAVSVIVAVVWFVAVVWGIHAWA